MEEHLELEMVTCATQVPALLAWPDAQHTPAVQVSVDCRHDVEEIPTKNTEHRSNEAKAMVWHKLVHRAILINSQSCLST